MNPVAFPARNYIGYFLKPAYDASQARSLPIFSGWQCESRQQRLIADSEGKDFAVVFAAMGVQNDVAEYFRRSFEETGVIQRVCMFLNLSNDLS